MQSKRLRPMVIATVLALGCVVAPPAQAVKDPVVHFTCAVWTTAYDAKGVQTTYEYDSTYAEGNPHPAPGSGFTPQAVIGPWWSTDGANTVSEYLAVEPSGWLTSVVVRGTDHALGYTYKTTTSRINSTWSSIRGLTRGGNASGVTNGYYVYGLTVNGLNRYTMQGVDGTTMRSAGNVGTSGWSSVQNLSYQRTVTLTTGGKADVLLAVISSTGALVEYTVPHDAPAQWTRTTLRASGWGSFTSLNTGTCQGNARSFLGINGNGDAYVYYDQYGDARTIVGGTVKVATGWRLDAVTN